MNIKNIIAAVAVLVAAGSASATPWDDFVELQKTFRSTTTRAELTNAMSQGQKDGSYVVGGREFAAPDANFTSTKTRAQVAAELRNAQDEGNYLVGGAELPGQLPAARQTVRHVASN